ncbi:MAG: hypothetical protein JWN60_771 [Acidobacteria bacterium]|jgi:CBS domain-containing protein|nr:hypothetical protein [Acidobacteriota bacterium]
MQVREIMTKNPASCTPEASLREIAQMMVEHDCGCIPVVENQATKKPIGTITDRDIAVRAFTVGHNPSEMKASDIMTMGITTVSPETSVQECCDLMEDKKIRRMLVVDQGGKLSGIVAQADVAQYASDPSLIGDMVHEISESEPTPTKGIMSRFRSRDTFSSANQSYSNRQPQLQNRSYMNRMPANSSSYSTEHSYDSKVKSKQSSLLSTGSLLPLLAGIGISVGAKYFLDSRKENKPRPLPRPETRNLSSDTHATSMHKTSDINTSPITGSGTAKSKTGTPSTVTDRTFNDDISRTRDDDDLKPILEVGRTANHH